LIPTYCLTWGLDFFLESARTLLVDGQELFGQFVQHLERGRRVDVDKPLFVLRRQGDLVVGPLAGEVNAEASHKRWWEPAKKLLCWVAILKRFSPLAIEINSVRLKSNEQTIGNRALSKFELN
jgi:hypothetical protein